MANLAKGEVVPTPTLPADVIVIRSLPNVTKRRVSSSVLLVSAVT